MRGPRFRSALALALGTLLLTALWAPTAQAEFGITEFDATFTDKDGNAVTEAGEHPFAYTTELDLEATFDPDANFGEGSFFPDGDIRDLFVAQIPGLVADLGAIPRCDSVVFANMAGSNPDCPPESAVGINEVRVGGETQTVPVYNLEPPPGVPLKLGFYVSGVVPVVLEAKLNPNPPYNAKVELRNVLLAVPFIGATLTVWGVPADPVHDKERGTCGESIEADSCSTDGPERPFLTLPRACEGPLPTTYLVDSWQNPASFLANGDPDLSDPAWLTGGVLTHDDAIPSNPKGFGGCGGLGFEATIAAAPSTRAAQSPSGLDFSLDVENPGLTDADATADSDVEKTVVTLPKGMTVNPSQAEGLEVCSEADLDKETLPSEPGEGCPEASKVGTIEVETPLLEDEILKGSLFVAEPYANPTGSLIAVYVVIRDRELGILVKQPIKVEPDPQTGQLISTAEELPQLPVSHFRLHFREGGRAPLISPPGCGDFDTVAKLYPYSGNPPLTSTSTFKIISGPNESPCPSGQAPFNPGFEAGTTNNAAGHYSPFHMRLTRGDGEQDLTRLSTILPPGVVGRIAGVPYCPEAAIALATSRTGPHGGREELDHPACPASLIGHTLAGAGVGSELTYVSGSLYLAGPYHGAPLSVVSVTPAVAGPFDAGTVVVRFALDLNPVTAEVEVDGSASDPIPHILKGIPLNVRYLRAIVDRPEFTLNATSCAEMQARATLFGGGTVLAPTADTPVALSARYQAADCASLGFKPKLSLKLRGGTRRGRFPALQATYTPRPDDANLSRLALRFPNSAFVEQGHFRTICTRVQFNAGQGHGAECPRGSIYGQVEVHTPLLDEPLEGPIYLRSSNHNLPDAVFALHGLVDIEVSVRIDSVRGRLRATVEDAPDAPVSKAIVEMQGGQKGLFINSRNLCVKPARNKADANLEGQNGRRSHTHPVVRALGCS
jgi:hypothetical protein